MPRRDRLFTKQEGEELHQLFLGAHLAALRKDRGLTQAQLGERVGVSQRVVSALETGTTRLPVHLLPALGEVLGVTMDELLAVKPLPETRKPDPKLWRKLEQVAELPPAAQQTVLDVIDGQLAKHGMLKKSSK